MNYTDLSKTDAENIQAILTYVNENGVIHKNILPETLQHISPDQYKDYKQIIFAIKPELLEDNSNSDNMGLPATDNLEDYMRKGGFLQFFNTQVSRAQWEEKDKILTRTFQQQQLEVNQQTSASNEKAVALSKSADKKASIAMFLAIIAVIIEIVRLVIGK